MFVRFLKFNAPSNAKDRFIRDVRPHSGESAATAPADHVHPNPTRFLRNGAAMSPWRGRHHQNVARGCMASADTRNLTCWTKPAKRRIVSAVAFARNGSHSLSQRLRRHPAPATWHVYTPRPGRDAFRLLEASDPQGDRYQIKHADPDVDGSSRGSVEGAGRDGF